MCRRVTRVVGSTGAVLRLQDLAGSSDEAGAGAFAAATFLGVGLGFMVGADSAGACAAAFEAVLFGAGFAGGSW
jgi:hypothetical protein